MGSLFKSSTPVRAANVIPETPEQITKRKEQDRLRRRGLIFEGDQSGGGFGSPGPGPNDSQDSSMDSNTDPD